MLRIHYTLTFGHGKQEPVIEAGEGVSQIGQRAAEPPFVFLEAGHGCGTYWFTKSMLEALLGAL